MQPIGFGPDRVDVVTSGGDGCSATPGPGRALVSGDVAVGMVHPKPPTVLLGPGLNGGAVLQAFGFWR